jgi:hypothetical protein
VTHGRVARGDRPVGVEHAMPVGAWSKALIRS